MVNIQNYPVLPGYISTNSLVHVYGQLLREELAALKEEVRIFIQAELEFIVPMNYSFNFEIFTYVIKRKHSDLHEMNSSFFTIFFSIYRVFR